MQNFKDCKEYRILITRKEIVMAKKLLLAVNTKRKLYSAEKCWLYHAETINILTEFNPNTVRSFLNKLKNGKIIEYIPSLVKDWGGAFRFTNEGEEQLNVELDDILKLLKLTYFQEIVDTHRSVS